MKNDFDQRRNGKITTFEMNFFLKLRWTILFLFVPVLGNILYL